MKVVLKICVVIILSIRVVECLLCDSDKHCFGGYPYCCGGYCKKSCNLTCNSSSDCGSLGHLQEKCCNGRCVGINSVCPQKNSQKTRLSSAHIAVLVLCIVVFVAVGTCALASYLCKCGYLYRRQTTTSTVYIRREGSELTTDNCTGSRGNNLRKFFVCKTPGQEDLDTPLQPARFSESSWVGKDFVQSRLSYPSKADGQAMKHQMKNGINL